MAWKDWLNKKVFVIVDTTSGEKRYSGDVLEVLYAGKNNQGIDMFLIEMNDKYGLHIGFLSDCVKYIKEES